MPWEIKRSCRRLIGRVKLGRGGLMGVCRFRWMWWVRQMRIELTHCFRWSWREEMEMWGQIIYSHLKFVLTNDRHLWDHKHSIKWVVRRLLVLKKAIVRREMRGGRQMRRLRCRFQKIITSIPQEMEVFCSPIKRMIMYLSSHWPPPPKI